MGRRIKRNEGKYGKIRKETKGKVRETAKTFGGEEEEEEGE